MRLLAGKKAFVFSSFRSITIALLLSTIALTGCGGGSSSVSALPPSFSSTPPAAALEGVLYTYNLAATDPAGGSVSFALSSGPSGAVITGSTLSWTPTHAQSRESNAFIVAAYTTEGGAAVQKFTVTPNGNVNLTAVDHGITGAGLVDYPEYFSSAEALVPNGSGGYSVIEGTPSILGSTTVANVPPGSFWLNVNVYPFREALNSYYVWTSSSDIDLGQLVLGRQDAVWAPVAEIVNEDIDLKVTAEASDLIDWRSPDAGSLLGIDEGVYPLTNPMLTSLRQNGGLIDSSKGDRGFLSHTRTIGNVTYVVEYQQFDSLAESNGGSVTLTGGMTVADGSVTDPVIKITQFDAINASVPGSDAPNGFKLFQLFDAGYPGEEGFTANDPTAIDPGPITLVTASLSQINDDTDLGPIPFQVESTTGIPFMQLSDLDYRTIASGGSTYVGQFGYLIVSSSVPTSASPIVPVLGEPTAVKVDGKDFLANQSNVSLAPQITWAPPTIGAPTGYELTIMSTVQSLPYDSYDTYCFYTSENNLSVPPGLLQPGTPYLFFIQAMSYQDGSIEKAPFRMGKDYAVTSEMSGLMTTTGSSSSAHKGPSATGAPKIVRVNPDANGRIKPRHTGQQIGVELDLNGRLRPAVSSFLHPTLRGHPSPSEGFPREAIGLTLCLLIAAVTSATAVELSFSVLMFSA